MKVKTWPLADDTGHAVVFEPSEIIVERAVLCWARFVEIADGFAWPRTCIRPVDETEPVCPEHGRRRAPIPPPKGS